MQRLAGFVLLALSVALLLLAVGLRRGGGMNPPGGASSLAAGAGEAPVPGEVLVLVTTSMNGEVSPCG